MNCSIFSYRNISQVLLVLLDILFRKWGRKLPKSNIVPSSQFTLNEQFESWSFLMTSFFRMLPKLFFIYSLSLLIVTKLSCREDHFRVQKFFIMTKKPRRSRASFSHQQLIELERRFSIQRWVIFFFETWKMQQLTNRNKCDLFILQS